MTTKKIAHHSPDSAASNQTVAANRPIDWRSFYIRPARLGPVFGLSQDGQRRVWMAVDDLREGGRALFGLSVSADREDLQLWRIFGFSRLQGNDPVGRMKHQFALMQLQADKCYEVFSLHWAGGFDVNGSLDDLAADENQPMIVPLNWLAKPDQTEALSPKAVPQEQLWGKGSSASLAQAIPKWLRQLEASRLKSAYVALAPRASSISKVRRGLADGLQLKPLLKMRPVPGGRAVFSATSCMYPGVGVDKERKPDALNALVQKADELDFAAMLGDQVYADYLGGIFDIASPNERFRDRYQDAFGSNGFRELATKLPLVMLPDDHEIADGWHGGIGNLATAQSSPVKAAKAGEAFELLRQTAIGYFWAYQHSHVPGAAKGLPFWHQFSVGGCHFFAMDTRFEREKNVDGSPVRLIGDGQRKALLAWLSNCQSTCGDAPKFILSGSVLAPGLVEYESAPNTADNWQAFPYPRAAVLKHIETEEIRNVVFVSGDYHCPAVAKIVFGDGSVEGDDDLQCRAIVAPPLYAPFRFANIRPEAILLTEDIDLGGAFAMVRPIVINGAPQVLPAGDGFGVVEAKQEPAGTWTVSYTLHTPQLGGTTQAVSVPLI
jgi:hypothetical protein